MGRKSKIGKNRKDSFYKLAKESGFRSRAAFKLIQLNRKFQFLQGAKILIDLCAAPGGWTQAALQYMPVSSIVIAIDLYPIKPINNAIILQEDITTDICLKSIQAELKTWKADVVLHDGAPNMGQNWLQDAYQQNLLTLSALKLSSQILDKGGYFITKIFRSKDYHKLIQVFEKLFKKVSITKPQASRIESAEIFAICQGFLNPSIDPISLDPKHVFKDNDTVSNKSINLCRPEKTRKIAEGYPEGALIISNATAASDFIQKLNFVDILSKATEIYIDRGWINNHPATTTEIKEYCKDIRVLGKAELKALLKWRKILYKELEEQASKIEEIELSDKEEEKTEDEYIERKIAQLKSLDILCECSNDNISDEEKVYKKSTKRKKIIYEKGSSNPNYDALDGDEDDNLLSNHETHNFVTKKRKTKLLSSGPIISEDSNPLIDLQAPADEEKKLLDVFAKIEEDDDEDYDMEQLEKKFLQQNKQLHSSTNNFSDEGYTSQESFCEEENENIEKDKNLSAKLSANQKLDAEGMALASLLVQSKKQHRDITDDGWNRYMFNDEHLPNWFVQDENEHNKKPPVISKELIDEYKQKLKEINARPLKKVLQAKARKKKRLKLRMEKLKKKAEAITENLDISEKEKQLHLKQLYKKIKPKKKPITYVITKKNQAAKSVKRPRGVKSKIKTVDARMKKDMQYKKANQKKSKKQMKRRK